MSNILFTDTAGTIRALWGDTVARINDLSPNARNSTQSNSALRGRLGRAPIGAAPNANLDNGIGPGFLRLDLSDDVCPITFAAGGTFDVLVAGRGGSWIERNVVVAPGGTINIGPNTIAGREAGVIGALGGNPGVWADIVGITILSRTITTTELSRLVGYYKQRGAKGLLVEGPEVLSNPGSPFLDTTGWVGTNAALSVVDGYLRVAGTGGNFARATLSVAGLTVGVPYILKGTLSAATAGAQPQFRTPALTPFQAVNFAQPSTQQLLFVPTSTSGQFAVHTTANSEGAGRHTDWAGFSLRRLIPEEEL